MAIYSLHHAAIGRSTHAPGTAVAHCRYITRSSACRVVIGQTPQDIALERRALCAWLKECEAQDRANGRVVDKIMVALPKELDEAQRETLVRAFCGRLTFGEVPWFAALHDTQADADNPHAHIVLRDRAFANGKRILKTSERGSTERARAIWEEVANEALAAVGSAARIDRRSNESRGIPFAPSVHLGAAFALERHGRPTWKGKLNRDVINSNKALEEALAIVREAEAALAAEKQTTLSRNEITAANDSARSRKKRRESLLSEAYECSLCEHPLAKYWDIAKTAYGLEFKNAAGHFIDEGDRLRANSGSDVEIIAMLQVARLKGWSSLNVSGTQAFCERVATIAAKNGFPIVEQHVEDRNRTRVSDVMAKVARVSARTKGSRAR